MKTWIAASACVLLLAACTVETSDANDFGSDETGTPDPVTTTASDATSGSEAGSSSSSGTTDGVDPDTSAGDSSSSGGGSSSSSSSGIEPGCGNGVQEDDEECDDGNDDDTDECTSACTVPRCDDGEQNGAETDVDCGGTCQGCALCQVCSSTEDCDGAMACDDAGQCVQSYDVVVDWVANCGGEASGVTLEGLELGTFRATAVPSAGTLWLPPHNPPTTGYFYEVECDGVEFEQMRTPAGVRYADANTAYAALISETEEFEFLGGDLTCWVDDAGCDDNNGTVEFSVQTVCER
ncbi:MAG: hypothetical protein AAGA54_16035 [Myxococcota bacterium]